MRKAFMMLLLLTLIAGISYGYYSYVQQHHMSMAFADNCLQECVILASQTGDSFLIVLASILGLILLTVSVTLASVSSNKHENVHAILSPPQKGNLTGSTILVE